MAKVVITIEDLPDGKVQVIAEPNLTTITKMNMSGHDITSAHGYAFKILNIFHRIVKFEDQKNRSNSPIIIPSN